jgi:hypothetical protein
MNGISAENMKLNWNCSICILELFTVKGSVFNFRLFFNIFSFPVIWFVASESIIQKNFVYNYLKQNWRCCTKSSDSYSTVNRCMSCCTWCSNFSTENLANRTPCDSFD